MRVLAELGTGEEGLSADQARVRLARAGPNLLPQARGPGLARLLDRRVLGRAFGFLGPVEAMVSMAMLPLGAALFFGWPAQPLPRAGADCSASAR
ncbi:MAG TPA: cation-transporting P-type ATPase [Actinomycetes bacterium]|nr:cation-transporting P-type ATPase [Actinomycetes bacterium]